MGETSSKSVGCKDGHLEKQSRGGTYSEGATLTASLNARCPFIPDGRLSSLRAPSYGALMGSLGFRGQESPSPHRCTNRKADRPHRSAAWAAVGRFR